MILREMTEAECAAVISASRLARLACTMDGQPYVIPIHVAYADDCLYGFSMPGQKIDWMRANPKVCVQIDEFTEPSEWRSVVVYGVYEELPDRIGWKRERERAWSHLGKRANWWEPGGLKPVPGPRANAFTHLFYRVQIESMTGRQAIEETPLTAV